MLQLFIYKIVCHVMRADVYIAKQKGISRSRAADLIKRHLVTVEGVLSLECDTILFGAPEIYLKDDVHILKVGRGYEKIKFAIQYFGIVIAQKTCLDVGASTGGFTQYLYEQKAKHIIAVDVGTNQMHQTIRDIASRNICEVEQMAPNSIQSIEIHEQQDIRTFTTDQEIDFLVCDISFISLRTILPSLMRLAPKSEWLLLFKPQFEVGKELNPTGIVKDESVALLALQDFIKCAREQRVVNNGDQSLVIDPDTVLDIKYVTSHIKGGDGNIEYWIYIKNK